MSNFRSDLIRLVSREAAAERQNTAGLADMIECISAALGMSIAIASRGDPKMIDTLMSGAEAYALEEAVERSAVIAALQRGAP